MKLKVVFLKKKHIYACIVALVLILSCLFFITLNNKSTLSTFNIISKDKIFKTDLTGDGEDDLLYVKTDKDKYYLQVNTKDNKSIFIEPEKKLGTIGYYYEYWPMRLTLKDINRDNNPEIFIQSCQKNNSIQHVFMWENGNFKDIFCSYNNILGFLDYSNNRTPKFISGSYKNDKINFSNYILMGNSLKAFNYNCKDNFIGKDTIAHFIRFMNSICPYTSVGKEELAEIVDPNIPVGNFKVLSDIQENTSKVIFQDALFKDSKYNKKGEISEISWLLNFSGISKDDKSPKNYTLTLSLSPSQHGEENFCFKITKISLNNIK